jgi:DNA-binding NarL/FixJ family response regulator
MNRLRILIADDHPVFRHGIRALLDSTPGMEIAGEATSGDEVIALAEQLQPDVILMDVKMPGLNGIEATQRIMQSSPQTRILVVTMFEDNASVFPAMRAGARGYVLKDASKEEILRAIQAVGNGEAIFSPSIATRLISFFATPRADLVLSQDVFPELTDREHEILDLIASGAPNHEIAEQLGLSIKTVSNYISNIFNKLQVADRSEAIVRARDAGLGRGA